MITLISDWFLAILPTPNYQNTAESLFRSDKPKAHPYELPQDFEYPGKTIE